VSSTQVAIVVTAVVLVIVLHQLMHRSRVGAAIRAVGWNAKSAELSGINPRRMILAASALAAGVVAVSGIFFSITNNGLEFTLGDSLLLKGFAAVVVGGFGYVRGAMLGGVLIGVSEALGSQYVSSSFRDAIGFTLLILFLFLRPRGILGTAELSENA
jgi:branched-chain amino acid transport system permease protein